MAAEGNEEEPKLTVKLRSEITEPEPSEYTVLKPAELIVEPEDEEESNNIEMENRTNHCRARRRGRNIRGNDGQRRHSKSPRAQTTARKSKETQGSQSY